MKRHQAIIAACVVLGFVSFIGITSSVEFKYEQPGKPVLVGVENQAPQVTIISNATAGKAPFDVQLVGEAIDIDGIIVSYAWDLGDGTISSEQAIAHTYQQAGAYSVALTVTDNRGTTATAELSLTANATNWSFSAEPFISIDTLGVGWEQKTKELVCLYGQNGGITQLTLPNAPNGVYDLWLRVYRNPLHRDDPHPRFDLDGKLYDFTPSTKLGYEWVFIKPVQITSHSLTFSIDDRADGGIQLRSVKLEETSPTGSPLSVEALPTIGSRPLPVQFSVLVNDPSRFSFLWSFGNGAISDFTSPTYTYSSIGTYAASVTALTSSGGVKTGSLLVNAEPRASDLVGLSEIEVFGFYSAGLLPNPGQKADVHAFNQRRMAELQNLNVNAVYLDFWPWWYDSEADRVGYHQFLDDLHAHGIQAIVKLTVREDWFSNDSDGIPILEWVFNTAEAEARFQSTDQDGNGISDLDGRIDVVYLEHEVMEFATYPERVQMYQLTKRYFPNTRILNYYGGAFILPILRASQPHAAGGFWADYQFGPGETDIIHVGTSRPFYDDTSPAERKYAIQSVIEHVGVDKQYADAIAPELPIWVHSSFSSDEFMESTPDSMWRPEELLGWAKTVLSIGGIQGLFIRSYGRFKYDLGFGLNTANPAQPETGYIEQRQAVGTIGAWIRDGAANY